MPVLVLWILCVVGEVSEFKGFTGEFFCNEQEKDGGHIVPLLYPCSIFDFSLFFFNLYRWMVQSLYIFYIVFVRSFGTPNLSSMAYSISWLMESKAFIRSMKRAYVSCP